MSVLVNVTTTATMTTANVDYTISGKPVGRGRRFDRMARGLARRLRIPLVRRTLREKASGTGAVEYGWPWYSTNALANASFARALCGRDVPEGERHETRPAGRSCETCLRILSRASGE